MFLRIFEMGIFYILSFLLFNTASSAAPQIPLSEDAGIEPRTIATLELTARLSNHQARSHALPGLLPEMLLYAAQYRKDSYTLRTVSECRPIYSCSTPFISITPSKPLMSSGSWLTLHNCEIFYLLAVNYDPFSLIFNFQSSHLVFQASEQCNPTLLFLLHKRII